MDEYTEYTYNHSLSRVGFRNHGSNEIRPRTWDARKSLDIILNKYGHNSSAYTYALSEYGDYLEAGWDEGEAEMVYSDCVGIYKKLPSEDKLRLPSCLAQVGAPGAKEKGFSPGEAFPAGCFDCGGRAFRK